MFYIECFILDVVVVDDVRCAVTVEIGHSEVIAPAAAKRFN